MLITKRRKNKGFSDTFIELTADQEKELLFASKEAKKGPMISQSEMDQKVEEWLSER